MLNNLFTKFASAGKDPAPSAEVVNGRISYTFANGVNAYQEELTLGQDEELVGVLMGLDISGVDMDKTALKEIIGKLLNDNVLYKLLQVVLIIPGNEEKMPVEKLKQLRNSELQAVIGDFFSLNPTARDWLKTIGSGLISGQTTTGISNS